MRFLIAFGKSLVGALAGVLVAMYSLHLVGWTPFEPWLGLGIAAGVALGYAIRSQWRLPLGWDAAVVGLLAGVGWLVGRWLSMHP